MIDSTGFRLVLSGDRIKRVQYGFIKRKTHQGSGRVYLEKDSTGFRLRLSRDRLSRVQVGVI